MATESVRMKSVAASRPAASPMTAWDSVKSVLKPLASLKLTVWLFAISALLVLIGTLALDKQGMWDVVDGYFRTSLLPPKFGFAWVEAKTFFPRKWFPEIQDNPELMRNIVGCVIVGAALIGALFSWLTVRSRPRQMVYMSVAGSLGLLFGLLTIIAGGFYFPGGMIIGAALTVNLLAAHTVRFTVQTRGLRLVSGLVVIALGIAVGVLIILHGHNEEGLRGEPPFSWLTLWWVVKGCLTLGWLACLIPAVVYTMKYFSAENQNSKSFALMTVTGIGAAILTVFVIFLWIIAPDWWVGESAIRVMWQLVQGTIAAVIMMVGCVLAFKKRAGIVLLHSGIGLLIFNELFVGMHAVEEQMMIEEGRTANMTVSEQDVELAVIDRSEPGGQAKVVAIPIAHNGGLTDLADDEAIIKHSDLPFDIQVVNFYENSRLEPLEKGEKSDFQEGVGSFRKVKELSPFSGADSRTNISAAVVKFLKKDGGKAFATRLLSQEVSDLRRLALQDELPEEVAVDGKTYEVLLRYKQVPKPYTIYLEDVRKVDYLGTSTPKDYSAHVVFKDEQRDAEHKHRIWMNNPMRYAGWTYYQNRYDSRFGNETTTLQVVKNRGWMIPYLACMVVVVGLAVHFILTLIRFLGRLSSPVAAPSARTAAADPKARPPKPAGDASIASGFNLDENKAPAWFCWGFPLAIVLLAVLVVGKYSMPPRTPENEMNLHEFGKLPVVYRGRAKPFDSLARDSLRVLSSRATYVDDSDEKQPAIHWLLGVISNSDDADKQRVFRITNLELLDALGLERRKGFRYSFSEFKDKEEMISKQASTAQRRNEEEGELLNGYQSSLIDLYGQISRYNAFRESFRLPAEDDDAFERLNHVWQGAARGQQLLKARVPFAIPTKSEDQSWQPLATAFHQVWIQDAAKKCGAKNIKELMDDLAAAAIENREACFDAHSDYFAVEFTKDILRREYRTMSQEEIDAMAKERLSAIDPEMKEVLAKALRQTYLDQGLYDDEVRRVAGGTPELLVELGYESVLESKPDKAARGLANILIAYREGNVERFNQEVENYGQLLRDDYDVYENDASKVSLEAFFNSSEWLLNSWILYIVAFALVALSWAVAPLGWYRPLSRAALWLIVFVFLVHTGSLVLRIIISGRPPVTNLYSSAVFIGWGGVLIGLIIEAVYRGGIGTLVASVSGIYNIAIAIHGLANDGDTMGVMQAVLDTQFWLATHVVCITMGYATMFLAGKIGILYVVLGLFTPVLKAKIHKDWTLGQVLTKLIYGIACFALFFSFFGTVLGGLWGDESWGRFWGWDPKENGALMIVIWSALVLHARWGKMVKDRGLAILAIGGNIVTAWSWFGVNQLGIGLHSYGFTEGVLKLLGFFVLSQLVLIIAGMLPLSLWRSFEDRDGSNSDGNIVDAKLA